MRKVCGTLAELENIQKKVFFCLIFGNGEKQN